MRIIPSPERFLAKSRQEQNDSHFIFLILILFSIMIFSLCFQDTINYDEYFSMQWCRLNYKDLMHTLVSDVHPPLYYLLLKPIINLTNENMFYARILSAIMTITLLWSGTLFLLHHFGKKSALFYACFLYLNPFMVQKATEIRMYMLASAFTIASGILSYYILKKTCKKHWFWFTLSSLAAAYTHYYALLVMCFLYAGIILYFICTKNKKGIISWLICAFCTIVGYLPWFPIALNQLFAVNAGYWIDTPTSRLAPLRELFYSAIPHSEHIYLGTIVLLIILAFIRFIKEKDVESYWTLMCCSALCGIMLFSIWYASHIRPILVSRYLIMAMCLCILGISYMTRFLHKYIVILLCFFCILVGSIRYQSIFRTQANRITTKTVQFITEKSSPDDQIIYVNDGYGYLAHCVEYYFPNIEYTGIEKNALSKLDAIISESNGSVWFLDDNEYMEPALADTLSSTVINWGSYGFGSTGFDLYEFYKE